jgi:acyl carrier protein
MTVQRSTLQAELVDLIARIVKIDPATVEPDARLSELGVKSLDMVEVIFTVEETYRIKIPYNANDGAQTASVEELLDQIIGLIEAGDVPVPAGA